MLTDWPSCKTNPHVQQVKRIWVEERAKWCKECSSSFREWFAENLKECSKAQLEGFAMPVWNIWNARNDLIFEDRYCNPEACQMKAIDLLQEFQHANDNQRPSQRWIEAKWSPPLQGVLKVNFDAATNVDPGRVGLGVVVRDDNGAVILAKARTSLQDWSAELAEAKAALE
ncbi:hypothetical protein RDABS01_021194 [Bienertia sinuspersici]